MRALTMYTFILFQLIFTGFLCAQTVNVTLVQNESAPAVAIEITRTIEDQLFDRFFDAGLIVSNNEIRYDGSNYANPQFAVKESAFGQADYLMAVYLQFNTQEVNDTEKKKTWAQLEKLTWRITKVVNPVVLFEKTMDISAYPIKEFDPYNQARLIADTAADEFFKELKKTRKGMVH